MSDAFYRFEYTLLVHWFSLDAEIRADRGGTAHVSEDDGFTLSPVTADERVIPCFGGLPVGGAWSFFFYPDVLVGRCAAKDNHMRDTTSAL